MFQAHSYNVIIIILCSRYDRLVSLNSAYCTSLSFPFLKWFQSYFKLFKTIMVNSVQLKEII